MFVMPQTFARSSAMPGGKQCPHKFIKLSSFGAKGWPRVGSKPHQIPCLTIASVAVVTVRGGIPCAQKCSDGPSTV